MDNTNQDQVQEDEDGTDEPEMVLASVNQSQLDILSDLANKTSDICSSAGIDTTGRVAYSIFEILLQCHRGNVATKFNQEMQQKYAGQGAGQGMLNTPQSAPGYPI